MDLPSRHAIREAAHVCYADAYASECESRNIPIGGPAINLCDCVEYLPDEVQFPLMIKYLLRIEAAWGYRVSDVFIKMGIFYDPDKEEQALCDLFLGCLGHGINLQDRFAQELDAACTALHRQLDPSPIYIEDGAWVELASVHIDQASDLEEPVSEVDLPEQAIVVQPFPDNILLHVGKYGAYLGSHPRADGRQMLFVVTAKLHYDSPIRYHDGSIGWNSPERIPSYLKRAAKKEFNRKWWSRSPYSNDHKPLPSELPAQSLLKVPRPRLYLPNPRALTLV